MELIDREAMIKRLSEWNTNDTTDKALFNFSMNRIIEQPTVESRPRGEWIDFDSEYNAWQCSECKHTWYLSCGIENKMNFCSNCGADMRKKV